MEEEFGAAVANQFAQQSAKLKPIIQEIIEYNNALKDMVINETMELDVVAKEMETQAIKWNMAVGAVKSSWPSGAAE
jgi:hypothetical protein